MRLVPFAIGCDRLKACQDFPAFGRVLLPHAGAVGIGLCDDLLQRDRPAAALVKFEPRQAGAPARTSRSAATSSKASCRPPLRPMPPEGLLRCAASPASAAPAVKIARRDPLMDTIGPLLLHLVAGRPGDDLLQARLDRIRGHLVSIGRSSCG